MLVMARARLFTALLLATCGEAREHEEDLFDKVYTMHMRNPDSPLHNKGADKALICVPSTGKDCSVREAAYIKEVETYSEKMLKNATATLIKEERDAHQSGRPVRGDDEHWLFQRKNILYHLQDDLKDRKMRKWAKQHDEL